MSHLIGLLPNVRKSTASGCSILPRSLLSSPPYPLVDLGVNPAESSLEAGVVSHLVVEARGDPAEVLPDR